MTESHLSADQLPNFLFLITSRQTHDCSVDADLLYPLLQSARASWHNECFNFHKRELLQVLSKENQTGQIACLVTCSLCVHTYLARKSCFQFRSDLNKCPHISHSLGCICSISNSCPAGAIGYLTCQSITHSPYQGVFSQLVSALHHRLG